MCLPSAASNHGSLARVTRWARYASTHVRLLSMFLRRLGLAKSEACKIVPQAAAVPASDAQVLARTLAWTPCRKKVSYVTPGWSSLPPWSPTCSSTASLGAGSVTTPRTCETVLPSDAFRFCDTDDNTGTDNVERELGAAERQLLLTCIGFLRQRARSTAGRKRARQL